MRATATSRICWSWKICRHRRARRRWGVKSSPRWRSTRPGSLATHLMGEKLSPAGKARYAQRKWLSEALNGSIKEVLGFRRLHACEAWRRCAASGTSCLGVEHQADRPTVNHVLRQNAGLPTHLHPGRDIDRVCRTRIFKSSEAFRLGFPSQSRAGTDVHTRAKIPSLRRPRANRPTSKLLRRMGPRAFQLTVGV